MTPEVHPAGGSLEKLTITYVDGRTRQTVAVPALFNPSELGISRSVGYEERRTAGKAEGDGPVQMLRSIEPATLSVELFFDTYEQRGDPADWARAGAGPGGSADVRNWTGKVTALARPDTETHRPPVCTLRWGRFEVFAGVLTSLSEQFTMFLADGTPVRARLSCSFTEAGSEATRRAGEKHSADIDKHRTVRRHDTLQRIAAEEYDDPQQWRAIAKANGIVNPRVLLPGRTLLIPRSQP